MFISCFSKIYAFEKISEENNILNNNDSFF